MRAAARRAPPARANYSPAWAWRALGKSPTSLPAAATTGSIARALMNDAQSSLADEPTAHWTVKWQERTGTAQKQLHQRGQKPSYIITHERQRWPAMPERLIEMRDGRITATAAHPAPAPRQAEPSSQHI